MFFTSLKVHGAETDAGGCLFAGGGFGGKINEARVGWPWGKVYVGLMKFGLKIINYVSNKLLLRWHSDPKCVFEIVVN